MYQNIELKADTDISGSDLDKVRYYGAITKDEVSTDATLDLKDDKFIKVDLKALNSDGAELAKPEAAEYTVEANVSKAGVLAATTDLLLLKEQATLF